MMYNGRNGCLVREIERRLSVRLLSIHPSAFGFLWQDERHALMHFCGRAFCSASDDRGAKYLLITLADVPPGHQARKREDLPLWEMNEIRLIRVLDFACRRICNLAFLPFVPADRWNQAPRRLQDLAPHRSGGCLLDSGVECEGRHLGLLPPERDQAPTGHV